MLATQRLLGMLVGISVAGLLGAASAGAGPLEQAICSCAGTYPPGTHSLELMLEPTAGPADTVVTVSGDGCSQGASFNVDFDRTIVGTIRADTSGTFSTTFRVPPGTTIGPHTVALSGAGCQVASVYVVQRAQSAPLAFTGFRSIEPLSEAAGVVILFGVVLLVASRRRRRSHRVASP